MAATLQTSEFIHDGVKTMSFVIPVKRARDRGAGPSVN